MRLYDMNWQMVEEYLRHDDRIVIPIGTTEQHGLLSVGTDAILAEQVALQAAEPLGIVVAPVLAYGASPYFAAFPGSPSLRISTLLAVVDDILTTFEGQGFRRFCIVNGHGGNAPVGHFAREWTARPRAHRVQVQFTSWYASPAVQAAAQAQEEHPTHGGWYENFRYNRIAGVAMPPKKPHVPTAIIEQSNPADLREWTVDGNFGGSYDLGDEIMDEIWRIGVADVHHMLSEGWAF
jgi:creatinine amidohydrolase